MKEAKMYKCESCNEIFDSATIRQTMGLCPNCSRNSLTVFKFNCPECGRNLGEPSAVDLNRIGWHCANCNIKIYKEID